MLFRLVYLAVSRLFAWLVLLRAAARQRRLLARSRACHGLRPSWRIRARLSSTPNAPVSFPLLTRKM